MQKDGAMSLMLTAVDTNSHAAPKISAYSRTDIVMANMIALICQTKKIVVSILLINIVVNYL